MAAYRLTINQSAADELGSIGQKKDRQRIVAKITELADNPRPAGCEKLTGAAARDRIRQGDYRVVYAIDDAAPVVEVVKIGHRRDIYRRGP